MEPRIFAGADAASRLQQLDLDEAILADALQMADADAAMCTEYDPPGNKGHVRWATAVRALRLLLVPRGWSVDNYASRGLATVVHPSGRFQIAVVTGDANTGCLDANAMPATKHPRGPAGVAAVVVNSAQGDLFARANVRIVGARPERCQTLFLLVHENGEELRAELSRPTSIGEHGRATEFVDRIVLRAIEVGAASPPRTRFDDGDEVEVSVRRR